LVLATTHLNPKMCLSLSPSLLWEIFERNPRVLILESRTFFWLGVGITHHVARNHGVSSWYRCQSRQVLEPNLVFYILCTEDVQCKLRPVLDNKTKTDGGNKTTTKKSPFETQQ
jgi:hypothetical protein